MAWLAYLSEWIDLKTIKTLSHHASGIMVAILFYGLIGVAIERFVEEDVTKTILKSADSFVLMILFVWLAYQMICILWNQRVIVRNRGVGNNVDSILFLVA